MNRRINESLKRWERVKRNIQTQWGCCQSYTDLSTQDSNKGGLHRRCLSELKRFISGGKCQPSGKGRKACKLFKVQKGVKMLCWICFQDAKTALSNFPLNPYQRILPEVSEITMGMIKLVFCIWGDISEFFHSSHKVHLIRNSPF